MPAFPTIQVPYNLIVQGGNTLQQVMQWSQQLGTNLKVVAQNQMNVNKAMMGGVGSFYLMNRARMASAAFFKEGIKGAQDLEFAQMRLQLATKANNEQMKMLSELAERTSSSLGPLNKLDVLQNMERLFRTGGMDLSNLTKLTPLMSTFVSNIVSLSDEKMSPNGAATMLQEFLSSRGGVKNIDDTVRAIRMLHSTIQMFGAENPQALVTGMIGSNSTMKALGVPLEAQLMFAAFKKMMPQSGRQTSGKDFADFMSTAVIGPTKKGQPEAMEALGVTKNGRRVVIGANGKADPMALLVSMSEAYKNLEGDIGKRLLIIKKAFPQATAQRLAMALSDNVDFRQELLSKRGAAPSMEETRDSMLHTGRGTQQQLTENLQNLRAYMFADPNKSLTSVMGRLVTVTDRLLELARKNTSFNTAGGLAATLLPNALMAWIAGVWLKSLSGFGIGFLSRILIGAGLAGTIAGAIAIVMMTGIALYDNRAAVLAVAKLMTAYVAVYGEAFAVAIADFASTAPSAIADAFVAIAAALYNGVKAMYESASNAIGNYFKSWIPGMSLSGMNGAPVYSGPILPPTTTSGPGLQLPSAVQAAIKLSQKNTRYINKHGGAAAVGQAYIDHYNAHVGTDTTIPLPAGATGEPSGETKIGSKTSRVPDSHHNKRTRLGIARTLVEDVFTRLHNSNTESSSGQGSTRSPGTGLAGR